MVEELKSWYTYFVETGDDVKIHSELQSITYRIVCISAFHLPLRTRPLTYPSVDFIQKGVQEGGRPEWELAQEVASSPRSPSQAVASLTALGASKDLALAEETFQFARTEVRDQDIHRCLFGLQRNPLTRRFLAERVKFYFDELEKRYAGTFNFKRFIEVCAVPAVWDMIGSGVEALMERGFRADLIPELVFGGGL